MKLTPTPPELDQELDQEVLLHRIANRIRQSLELREILTATVAEIRSFLRTDRVMIYRFHASGAGEVLAESVAENRLPSLLGLNFPADDIPIQAREQFLKTRQRSIVDLSSQQIGISPLNCWKTGQPLATTEIQYRPADLCHILYLRAMGVQFSLVVPLLHREQLWGLLVAHHSEAFAIADAELQFVQRVADEVSIAIAQSTLLSFAREQAQREATVNRIASILHTLQTLPLQIALQETVSVIQGCGGRLYLNHTNNNASAEVYTTGIQPPLGEKQILEQHPMWQQWLDRRFQQTASNLTPLGAIAPQLITDIYTETELEELFPAFSDRQIRSLAILPLQYRQQLLGYLTIFGEERNTETWWAGKFDPNQQQLHPRQSFEAWREFKTAQPREWTDNEIELLQAIGHHFSVAIQQHQLYQQVQTLNANLESQVAKRTQELQQRTLELQQSLELARVLKQVTNQIRSTLDLPTILQTIVREVRDLLDTDRVIVYQFLETWQGKVVVEEVTHPSLSILGQVFEPNCFPVEYTYQYQAGRVRAISNIAEAGLSPCHVEFLQQIHVEANLVVPIRRSDRLWGLLVAHECYNSREWQAAEVELLQQLAAQAAIAIYQAELYEHSLSAAATATDKAQQLEQALEDLQRTQSQLIQTEKMSSLGQLVAGIAHEINNPINFIYGNLSHVSDYVKEIYRLLELYQQEYPQPTPKLEKQIAATDLDFLAEDLPKTLSSMKAGSERICQLVLSLRNFSRLDESERKSVDLHDGLESSLLILQYRLKDKTDPSKIQIIKDYSQLPPIECWAGQLNQVFMNILTNALDALEQRDSLRSPKQIAKSPSKITIRTFLAATNPQANSPHAPSQNNSPRAIIQIIDNGPGMTEAVQAQIFNPFFTTKPVGKGTGLGLYISYQIVVEKHGGALTCTSQLGKGTEFTLEIPLNPLPA